MVELLQKKNSATRFRIMAEIAASGQTINQKGIAIKLGISPQAISDYIQQLASEELIETADQSACRVSIKGINWMLKMLREINDYIAEASRAITNITVCAAIAERDLASGQVVGLKMVNGLLSATVKVGSGARGITVTAVKQGEDVGISNIEGLVEFSKGKITVLEVPSIQDGGSRQADWKRLKTHLTKNQPVGAIGIEALTTLRRKNIEPRYLFGVTEAAIEKSKCGSSFLIVCTADAISGLIRKLQESNTKYEVISLSPKINTSSATL